MSNLDYAIEYAQKGWLVFPVHYMIEGKCSCGRQCKSPGKHPIRSWKKATTSESIIRGFWKKYPDANIGIVTGEESNLIVLDIDPRNGGDNSLDTLISNHPELSNCLNTLSVSTGGGGTHYFFKWRGDQKTRHGAYSGGIDIQSDGAYVVAPPSNHISGGVYDWDNDGEILLFPDCLKYDGKQIADTRWQGEILEGTRNTTLTSLAGTLFHKGFNASQVFTKLLEENIIRCNPPLAEGDIRSIVNSIKDRSNNDSKKSFKTTWQELVIRSDKINPNQARTLMALSTHMNADGKECFPSQELLASEIHFDRATVNRHLKKAQRDGLIKIYSHSAGNGKFWHNGYIALIPPA